MAPKFDPGSCPKPQPPAAPSCLDLLGAHPCVCTTCTCGTHRCVPGESSKFQPLNITGKDIRMQGTTEYNDRFYQMRSGTARKMKDMTSLPGCYPMGNYYPTPLHTDYTELFDKKPVFPAKLWNPKTSHKVGPTFYGHTVYADCYQKWQSEPRTSFKPPGFVPVKAEFDDRTTYTTNFKEPKQMRRKPELFPPKQSVCEVCDPTTPGLKPYKTKEEDVRVVNIKGADLDGRTTYGDFYYNQGPSDSARTVKPIRWGAKVEPLEGVTTYGEKFQTPPNKEKTMCPVMKRPMPTSTVSHHQCYP